jgi:hypothetical protein
MTSTSIYTPITPTYLYIKQHSVTKKKYFGKTTRDPYTYNGSGKVWTRHIKKHGKEHIVTLWVSELYHDTSIVEVALQFSADNDIVNSKEWANLILENGLDGGSVKGRVAPFKNKKHTEEAKANMRKPKPEEQKAKMRKPKSEEAKANMRKPKSQSPKRKPQPQVTCPHCGKTGGENAMKRWHFDKCSKAGI